MHRLTTPIKIFFTMYLPVILVATKMTELSWSENCLVPTILLVTIFVDAARLILHPLFIKPRFFETIVQFDTDDDSRVLHQKIIDFAEENGYMNASERILLTESRSSDLHSTASVNMRNIVLNKQLLRHHRGHDEEILAILKHELGQWKHMDIFKIYALDLLYMVVFAFVLQVVVNNHTFLRTFGFY
jgi:Zn-dependent protease with chaperone function